MLQIFAIVLPIYMIDGLFASVLTAAGKTTEIAVIKTISVAAGVGLNILIIPTCQARFGNGGIGLVLALGSTEVLMLTAYLWLMPLGALDRGALVDLSRAAVAAGGTVTIMSAMPSMSPWLAVPVCLAVFMALALATSLVLRSDLEKIADLVRNTTPSLSLPIWLGCRRRPTG